MKTADVIKESESLPSTPMPSYISHKRVWALKIKSVFIDDDGVVLVFEDQRFAARAILTQDLAHKPVPLDGMYYVQYENGYFSFSPADAFEKGYTSTDNEPMVEKITVSFGKPVITPAGELKTIHVTQETRWGIIGEILLTAPQALSLAKQIEIQIGSRHKEQP